MLFVALDRKYALGLLHQEASASDIHTPLKRHRLAVFIYCTIILKVHFITKLFEAILIN